MGDFGEYQQVEQIDLAGYVWTARKGTGAPAQFALRFRDPPALLFRAAAEVQKQVAESKAPGWAPVHAIGDTYYVTDAYPWSAQLLFEQKDRVTSPHLLRLTEQIAAALQRIAGQLGRQHGNLKLSNVLLSARDLERTTAALCDPAPTAPTDPAADRRALGRIIFELVTGQIFRDYFWPVVSGEKWEALGPDGPKWLDWCNRLLAPADNATACSIEQFQQEVEIIRPAPTFGQRMAALPWKRVSAVAAVVLVVGAGALIAYRLYERAKLNAAIAETHLAIDHSLQQFTDQIDAIEQSFASIPALQKSLERADLVDQARQVDAKVDLASATEIDQLPPRRQQAIQQIETIRDRWRAAALDTLAAHRYGVRTIDDDDALQQSLDALKPARNVERAVQLVSAVSRLAAAWPSGSGRDADRAGDLAYFALPRIIANPAQADTVIAGFTKDLHSEGDPVLQARVDAAEEIQREQSRSKTLDRDFKLLAPPDRPDLYTDLHAATQSLPFTEPGDTLESVTAWKQNTLRQILELRTRGLGLALAKARKMTFGPNTLINQGFAAFSAGLSPADPETALRRTAKAILSMETLRTIWPAAAPLPLSATLAAADRKSIDAAYQQQLIEDQKAVIQSVADARQNPRAAVSQLKDQDTRLRATAQIVAAQFLSVLKARGMLKDGQRPPQAPEWEQLKDALTLALRPTPRWPDAAVDAQPLLEQVNTVLAALRCEDIAQLQAYSAPAGPPALLSAVCLRWPAVVDSPDPNVDYAIYQNISKGLGQLPPQCAAILAGHWSLRLKTPADSDQADFLWDLARKMNLQHNDPALGRNYFNDLLGYLKSAFPAYKKGDKDKAADAKRKSVVGVFIAKTDGSDQWGLTSEESSAVSDFRQRLQFNPRPGTGPLPKDFQRLPDGDVVYTPPQDSTLAMRFKLMIYKTGGSYYLCTTEVPLGWFLDMAQPEQFKSLMDRFVPQFRFGPCAWRRDGNWISVNNATAWFPPDLFAPWSSQCNPVDPASPVKPMQYVSPLAAMEAARLIGCRLPTVAEWLYAFNSDQRDNDDNTNGPNWQTLRRAIAAIPPPNDSSTRYYNHFRTEVPLDSVSDHPANVNDVLWFRDVPPNFPRFHDMRGNIQNWVLDVPPNAAAPKLLSDNPLTLVDAAGTHVLTGQNDPQLVDFYQHCMRLGLSSTSPPDQDPEKPSLPVDPNDGHHHQFFDVGFRLALDDTPPDPMEYIADSIAERNPL
jgi:formylglycine-generating enzyme required for sulfatase activity